MLTITEIAGYAGAGLAGAEYVPQISHLIRDRCSAGISRLAFAIPHHPGAMASLHNPSTPVLAE